jgi:hypothetical protein
MIELRIVITPPLKGTTEGAHDSVVPVTGVVIEHARRSRALLPGN